jgi:nitroreductase
MKASEFIAQSLPAIIENARFAPSVHNSQPWVVSTKDNAVVVELDRQHTLGAGDPTGRAVSQYTWLANTICFAG